MDLMEFEEELARPRKRKKVSKKICMAGERFKKEPVKPPTVVCVMNCIYKQEKCQALRYSDGSIKVGVDVIRLLDKHDFPSFEVREFRTFAEFSYYCTLLPEQTSKAWYMNNPAETEE